MVKKVLLLPLLLFPLHAYELLILGNKDFPRSSLTPHEIRAIFLAKQPTIEAQKILVMNHPFNHPFRQCFERVILHKSQESLERYWRKAYYQGKRPPKIIKSTPMLLSYLNAVHPSIGYNDGNMSHEQGFKILYRFECPNP